MADETRTTSINDEPVEREEGSTLSKIVTSPGALLFGASAFFDEIERILIRGVTSPLVAAFTTYKAYGVGEKLFSAPNLENTVRILERMRGVLEKLRATDEEHTRGLRERIDYIRTLERSYTQLYNRVTTYATITRAGLAGVTALGAMVAGTWEAAETTGPRLFGVFPGLGLQAGVVQQLAETGQLGRTAAVTALGLQRWQAQLRTRFGEQLSETIVQQYQNQYAPLYRHFQDREFLRRLATISGISEYTLGISGQTPAEFVQSLYPMISLQQIMSTYARMITGAYQGRFGAISPQIVPRLFLQSTLQLMPLAEILRLPEEERTRILQNLPANMMSLIAAMGSNRLSPEAANTLLNFAFRPLGSTNQLAGLIAVAQSLGVSGPRGIFGRDISSAISGLRQMALERPEEYLQAFSDVATQILRIEDSILRENFIQQFFGDISTFQQYVKAWETLGGNIKDATERSKQFFGDQRNIKNFLTDLENAEKYSAGAAQNVKTLADVVYGSLQKLRIDVSQRIGKEAGYALEGVGLVGSALLPYFVMRALRRHPALALTAYAAMSPLFRGEGGAQEDYQNLYNDLGNIMAGALIIRQMMGGGAGAEAGAAAGGGLLAGIRGRLGGFWREFTRGSYSVMGGGRAFLMRRALPGVGLAIATQLGRELLSPPETGVERAGDIAASLLSGAAFALGGPLAYFAAQGLYEGTKWLTTEIAGGDYEKRLKRGLASSAAALEGALGENRPAYVDEDFAARMLARASSLKQGIMPAVEGISDAGMVPENTLNIRLVLQDPTRKAEYTGVGAVQLGMTENNIVLHRTSSYTMTTVGGLV